jgi:hypothetical protein
MQLAQHASANRAKRAEGGSGTVSVEPLPDFKKLMNAGKSALVNIPSSFKSPITCS